MCEQHSPGPSMGLCVPLGGGIVAVEEWIVEFGAIEEEKSRVFNSLGRQNSSFGE